MDDIDFLAKKHCFVFEFLTFIDKASHMLLVRGNSSIEYVRDEWTYRTRPSCFELLDFTDIRL